MSSCNELTLYDLDLKDGRFGAAEASTIGAVIDGLQLAHAEDQKLREHGMMLFESLYRTFDRAARRPRPRARRKSRSR